MRRYRGAAIILILVALTAAGGWGPRARADTVNYALLFSGGVREFYNEPRFYWNTQRAYDTLINVWDYEADNITVLFADGQGSGSDQLRRDAEGGIYYVDSDPDLDGDTVADIEAEAATGAALQAALADLETTMDSDDTFLMWASDHGGRGIVEEEYRGYIWGWGTDEAIYDWELADWTSGFEVSYEVYTFGFCYAGEFIGEMSRAGRMIMTAAAADESAYGYLGMPSDPSTDYDEFLYEWDAGLIGGTADLNSDGFVSIYESFQYARDNDDFYLSGDEHPQWDDPSGLGPYYTLTGAVPEPSTLVLVLMALSAAAARLRRRQQ